MFASGFEISKKILGILKLLCPRICLSKRMAGLQKLADKFEGAQKLSDLQKRSPDQTSDQESFLYDFNQLCKNFFQGPVPVLL